MMIATMVSSRLQSTLAQVLLIAIPLANAAAVPSGHEYQAPGSTDGERSTFIARLIRLLTLYSAISVSGAQLSCESRYVYIVARASAGD